MVLGFTILLGFWLLGAWLAQFVPIPGSVLGMLLLALALRLGWIRRPWVEPAADLLLSHLPLFFVPAGVAVALESGTLDRAGGAILIASVVSLLLVFVAVGRLYRGPP